MLIETIVFRRTPNSEYEAGLFITGTDSNMIVDKDGCVLKEDENECTHYDGRTTTDLVIDTTHILRSIENFENGY